MLTEDAIGVNVKSSAHGGNDVDGQRKKDPAATAYASSNFARPSSS
jgi:hypothetical protein